MSDGANGTPSSTPAPSGSGTGGTSAPESSGPIGSTASQTNQPVQRNGTAPPPTGEQSQAAAEKKYLERMLKRGGKEVPVKATEDDLWNAYSRLDGLDRRLRELGEQRKEIETRARQQQELEERLLEDPFFFIRQKDPNFDETDFLTKRLHGYLARERELPDDPRARALLQREEAIARREQELQMEQQQRQEQMEAYQERQKLNQLGARFLKALPMVGLPNDDVTMDMMARVHYTNEEAGLELTDEELAKATFDAAVSQQNAIFSKLSGDELLDRFPQAATKIHQALVARYKAKQSAGQTQEQRPSAPRPPEPQRPEPVTEAEIRRRDRERGILHTI